MAFAMTAGLIFAAYRAWNWPDRVRPRQLVVTAPEQTRVIILDGPKPSDVTRGVHAWMVKPGPLTLVVTHSEGAQAEADITIPKGLGTLMLDVHFNDSGDLQIGYF